MRMYRGPILALLGLPLLLASLALNGCSDASDGSGSGSASGGSGSNGEPVELGSFAELTARATCARVFDCCTEDEIETHFNEPGFVAFRSEQDCVTFYQGFTEALAIPALRESIERGYLEYDADAVGACLQAFASVSCAETNLVGGGDDDECPGAFVPLQSAGDPCISDGNCIAGSCDLADEGEGTCAPLPQAGEACDFTCAERLRCGLDTDSAYRCLPRLALGETCSREDDCESLQCRGEVGAMTCQDESVCQGA